MPDLPTTPERPLWSQRRAATECGVSRSTIQRALKAGRFPSAVPSDDGWLIPVEDLIMAGFHPGRSVPQPPIQPITTTPGGAAGMIEVPVEEYVRLRTDQERATVLVEHLTTAQATIAAHLATITDLRTLTARQLTAADPGDHPDEGRLDIAPPRRQHWWGRKRA